MNVCKIQMNKESAARAYATAHMMIKYARVARVNNGTDVSRWVAGARQAREMAHAAQRANRRLI